ncbi:MAG: hypothetical protein EXQ53_07330 [Acidobacteria bacterium]|nr:hypothetical protein [Acidobacteriota bacterium]
MRRLLVVSAVTAVYLSLLTQTALTQNAPPQQTISALRRAGPPKGPVPRLPNGMVNLGDLVWLGGGSGGGNIETQGGLKKGELDALMLPWAKALMASRDVTQDPHNFCMPDVVPRTTPFPWRFVQNYTHTAPTHLFIVNEANIHSFRQIFMDGRTHPADLGPTWYGHSIGWWEKDTLVIDTVGFNDKAWFDGAGHPHTEQLHTTERWTRLDLGRLENRVTIDDPGAYTRPWTVTFMATATPGDEVMEYICQENNQYGAGNGK